MRFQSTRSNRNESKKAKNIYFFFFAFSNHIKELWTVGSWAVNVNFNAFAICFDVAFQRDTCSTSHIRKKWNGVWIVDWTVNVGRSEFFFLSSQIEYQSKPIIMIVTGMTSNRFPTVIERELEKKNLKFHSKK